MALRSNISGIRGQAAAVAAPAEGVEIEEVEEVAAAPVARKAAAVRGHVEAPAVETPLTAKPPRGRPRLSDEEKAAKAAEPKAERKPRAAKAAGAQHSATELRAALKEVEADARAVREAVAAATAKFQPKIDALRAKHAELSSELAHSLFK